MPDAPAVLLLFAVFANDWNLQERLAPVGERYQLPMVSIRDAVTPQFRQAKAELFQKISSFMMRFTRQIWDIKSWQTV